MTGRVERLPKERFRSYRDRAEGLARTMEDADRNGQRHGAALTAIHAALSAADALTVFYLGERSRGQDHQELVALVSRLPLDESGAYARRLASILGKKTEAEYGASGVTVREAAAVVLQSRRFRQWALAQLPR